MNIAAIQTFLCVVRTKNLNSAAAEMNVTQSAVTARLDGLEQVLGQKLLVRSRKGATMTKAGFAFLEQAEVIARTWENAKAKVSLPRGITNLFSFACDPALWGSLGEAWVKKAKASHPDTAFEVWSGHTPQVQSWLQSGMTDAGLLTEPIVGPTFQSREFATEQLIQVSTTPRQATAWDPGYVYVDYGPAVRAQHVEAWPGDNTARMAFSNPDWALRYLLAQGGSAYLPTTMAAPLIAERSLFVVEGAIAFTRKTYLAWRPASAASFPWIAP
jgi:DNA-binding transcriptional LysR family regulator